MRHARIAYSGSNTTHVAWMPWQRHTTGAHSPSSPCLQDLQDAIKHLARQKALLAAAQKSSKTLQADCVKKGKEQSVLEQDLKALLSSAGEADAQCEVMGHDVQEKEAAAAAAAESFAALFEQVRAVLR
jgi:hypothetical protein